ncbi:hypothetical protein [Archangium lipolyticum]|uniref:hypothetical protein n=1 Tax=Archangium lipolyticum TaxID=2970465 RepID=UPI00214A4A09|nr:hypothetical protein [Archangium lipolyticum]
MHRLLLSCLLLSLGLCACDSRRDFAGSYDVSGSLTTSMNGRSNTSRVEDDTLVIIADALDSDALYLDFDCGLTGKMKDAESFTVDARKCPSYTADGCTFTWTYRDGTVRGDAADDTKINLTLAGTIEGSCSDGSAGQLGFAFSLSGKRKDTSSSGSKLTLEPTGEGLSPQMSALRSELERAMRPHLE